MVSTTGSRADLGWGHAGWALNAHLRGVRSEHFHTNLALGLLLLQSTEVVKMQWLHG